MPGIMDIAPLRKTVSVNGVEVEARGLPFKIVFSLFGRFPELGAAFAQSQADDGEDGGVKINIAAILSETAPKAVSAIVAAGLGHLGNRELEERLEELDANAQLTLLSEVVELTIGKDGFGPFAKRLAALAGAEAVTSNQASMHQGGNSHLQ